MCACQRSNVGSLDISRLCLGELSVSLEYCLLLNASLFVKLGLREKHTIELWRRSNRSLAMPVVIRVSCKTHNMSVSTQFP